MPGPPVAAARLDTRYAAETPEGISLALRPAGIVARGYAYAIDFLIRSTLILGIVSTAVALRHFGVGLALIAFFALEWLYPVAFELSRKAATPGKRALGLAVVMDTGLPITPAASLTRNLLRAADFLPWLYAFGLLSMLFRADFKRLGDLAAGTLVIHVGVAVPSPVALPDVRARAPEVPLSARAQAAIVGWGGRLGRLTEARADELASLAVPTVLP
ncbi:MAG: RDD family protein, partial [Pseudomonadota bacterium]|nr:RDD family protein [Pseudomonadota bacterium]